MNPLGRSHADYCPLSYEEADEDAVCICGDEDVLDAMKKDAERLYKGDSHV